MATTDTAIRWLAAALDPLAQATTDEGAIAFVETLGWTLPATPPAWAELGAATDDLLDALADTITARSRVDGGAATADWDDANVALGIAAAGAIAAIAQLGPRLRTELPAAYIATTAIADEIVDRLYAALVVRFFRDHFPRVHAIAIGVGVFETRTEVADPARAQPAFTRTAVHWRRLAQLVSDPSGWLRDVYGWGTAALDVERLFAGLLRLSYFLTAPAEVHYPSLEQLAAFANTGPLSDDAMVPELWMPIVHAEHDGAYLVVTPVPGAPEGLALGLAVRGSVDAEVPWRPNVVVALHGAAQIADRSAIVLVPGVAPRVVGAPIEASGLLGVELRVKTPTRLFAISEHSFVDAEQLGLSVVVEQREDGPDAYVELAIAGGQLAVSGSDGDGNGLLAAALPAPGVGSRFDARVRWSVKRGVHFAGTAALELAIPATASFGPVRLRQLAVAIEPGADELAVAARVALGLGLGPLTLDVDGVGVRAALRFEPGNLGAADLAVGFAPPRGLSIALDAGPVAGGGALAHDPATGRYAGALAVRVFTVEAAAFGILDTRPPGGGFAFVAAIGTRFPSMPLGLGFTLDGIGGLLGVHRRLDVDAARAAVRAGGLATLLSTDDPIARAPEILQTLGALFPVAHGRHILGPSVRLGWGAPKLVAAELALFLEVPAPIRIVLLGAIRIGLPTIEKAVVDLRLDVLGVIDLGRGTLAIDASLHDSTIAGYAITGDLAVRIGWAADPQFLISIGGFHPAFRPPAQFPTPRRLQLVAGDNPQLTVAGYLAVTSNTAQFGARAELVFKGGGFEIGGHVNFDALFEFSPFHFEIEIDASASIKYHSIRLASVKLDFVLSGPRPWHAAGEATFGVLWWDVSVGFDETWGDPATITLPPPPDIAAALRDALARRDSWSGALPAGEPAWIALRADAATSVRVHPLGRAIVRQQVVPLAHDITQFGSIPLPSARRFAIDHVTLDTSTGALSAPSVEDRFAPGQFTRLDATDRLAAPAFEQFPSGVELGANELVHGEGSRVAMDVATRVFDPLAPPAKPPILAVDVAIVRGARPTQAAPPLVTRGPRVVDLAYVLASTENLSITAEGAALGRGAPRYATLSEALRRSASRRLQVIPRVETLNHQSRVVVVREDENLRNVDFVDTVTGETMTREQFVAAIHANAYPEYAVRMIRGLATPVAHANAVTDDNLG